MVEKWGECKISKIKKKYFKNKMLSGLKDTDREILKHVDDDELIRVCSIDRKTWNEVCDDNFLKRRLARYPGIEKYKSPNESWKEFFLKVIYYTAKMRETHKFEYKSGDFKKQYEVLKSNFRSPDGLLQQSANHGFLDLVKYAIQRRASNSAKHFAFRTAAFKGHYDIVKWLVENGVNIHFEDDIALRDASDKGHLEVVKYLIEKGANIHAESDQALGYASRSGHLEVVKFLLQAGAKINAYNDYALRMAAANGHLDIVKYLVEHGANVHAMGGEVLIGAAYNRRLDVVKYLVSVGADPHAKKDTALQLAQKNGHTEISDYLRSV